MIAGLTEAGAQRIVAARQARPFADVADLAHRARLDRRDLRARRCRRARGARRPSSRRGVGRRRRRAAAAAARRQHLRRSGSGPAARRPRDRTSSPITGRSSSRCAVIRSRCCASDLRAAAAAHCRRHQRGAARPHRAHRRHRHRPPAARHRERRRLRHAGGRNRRDQRDRLARSRRSPAPRAARLTSCWRSTARSSAKAPSCTCSPGGSSISRRCWASCRPNRGIFIDPPGGHATYFPSGTPLPRHGASQYVLRGFARDRRRELLLRHGDRRDVGQRDAVLHRGDFGENRHRDLRRRAAADVEADRPMQPRDLGVA